MSRGKGRMNLPNRLTLLRLFMVPFCMIAVILPENLCPETVSRTVAFLLFVAASVTDCLDGKIARARGLITDFGKLFDPLADKFMVIGTMLAVLYRYENVRHWLFWVVVAIIFRELGVTSLRLVTAGRGVVVPASILGKIKTVSQIVTVSSLLFEPVLWGAIPGCEAMATLQPISIAAGAVCTLMTIWSGIDYFRALWKYIDTAK